MPTTDSEWDKNLAEVGTWTITFADPQPSLFSDWRICEEEEAKSDVHCASNREKAFSKVYTGLNAPQVLSYELAKKSDGKPSKLSEYISQQDYYQSVLTNFNKDMASDKATADNFCRKLLNDMTALGLNGEDATIVVWAVINGMPQSKMMHPDAYEADACSPAQDVQSKIDLAKGDKPKRNSPQEAEKQAGPTKKVDTKT